LSGISPFRELRLPEGLLWKKILNMTYLWYEDVRREAIPYLQRILRKKRVNLNKVIYNDKVICIDISHDNVMDLKNIFERNGFTGNITNFNEALQIDLIECIWDRHPCRISGNLGMCLTLVN